MVDLLLRVGKIKRVLFGLIEAKDAYRNYVKGRVDASGVPTHACPTCGCTAFKTVVQFQEGEISWYTLTGYCYLDGTKVTLPTPEDFVPADQDTAVTV